MLVLLFLVYSAIFNMLTMIHFRYFDICRLIIYYVRQMMNTYKHMNVILKEQLLMVSSPGTPHKPTTGYLNVTSAVFSLLPPACEQYHCGQHL